MLATAILFALSAQSARSPASPAPEAAQSDSSEEVFDRVVSLSDVWKACTKTAVAEYAKATDEPVDTLVKGAYGKCAPRLDVIRASLRAAEGGKFMTSDEIEKVVTHLSDSWRDKLFAAALDVRSRRKH